MILKSELAFLTGEFVSVDVMNEDEVRSKLNITFENVRSNLINRLRSFVNYLRIITRTNNVVSGLNTNFLIRLVENEGNLSLYGGWIQFFDDEDLTVLIPEEACGKGNPIRPSGFYPAALGN